MIVVARAPKPCLSFAFLFLIASLLFGPLGGAGGRDLVGVDTGGISMSGKPSKSEVEVEVDDDAAGDGTGVLDGLEMDTKVSSLEEDEDLTTAVGTGLG